MTGTLLAPRCLLTVLFAIAAVHALGQLRRPKSLKTCARVDHVLHAVMGLAMVFMLWSRAGEAASMAMTFFFFAAGLWFPLTAAGLWHGRVSTVAGRLPHALGMAAMVWMLHSPHEGAGSAHRHMAGGHSWARPLGVIAPVERAGPLVSVVLAWCLLGCALWSLTRPMPGMRAAVTATRLAAAAEPFHYVRDGATALGTAVMLLLPH
ncbi:DUF5134 domain-containing protein [Streptomyces longwoodensis]|uniref:DUF5134 domain-containing protein n=1 Tax=Streptomyces longwoodensis TaxID=68231 RepID=UPI0033EE0E7F